MSESLESRDSLWEWGLSSHYVVLRDRAQAVIRLFQLSHFAQPQPFPRQGLGPGLPQTQRAACPFLPAGVPVTGGRRTGWSSLRDELWVWSLVSQRLASVCSTRTACMGCTRMCIISTPSTRCRACRCCSARLECAQVRHGQGTAVRVSGPSLTPPGPSSSVSSCVTCCFARPAGTQVRMGPRTGCRCQAAW